MKSLRSLITPNMVRQLLLFFLLIAVVVIGISVFKSYSDRPIGPTIHSIVRNDPDTRIVRLYLSPDLEQRGQVDVLRSEIDKIEGVTGVGYVSAHYIREASSSPTGKERSILEIYSKDPSTVSKIIDYASEKEGIEETAIIK